MLCGKLAQCCHDDVTSDCIHPPDLVSVTVNGPSGLRMSPQVALEEDQEAMQLLTSASFVTLISIRDVCDDH